ncbi:hypothetical protein CC2G_011943 [Coprinopsis cinerea AmutBmut pab1-1]|nr:hypothetical protein CC2G_011943 [Coprinopsis cinerea AmutBmut pab1-1]
MFILITFHICLNIYSMIHAFAYTLSPFSAVSHFRDLTNWDSYAFPVVLALLTWIGDILVIFRCFLIWDSNCYVIALPSLLLLGSIVSASVNLHWFRNVESIPFEIVQGFLNATFPLNLAQNLLTTGLIIYKIWDQHRASRRAGIISSSGLSLLDVVRIIIESALIYTTQMLLLTILFAIAHPAHIIVQHALVPSMGIVFVLISVRTHVARSQTISETELEGRASLVPSWLNTTNHNHVELAETRRTSRSHIPFVTNAVERHHLEDMPSKDIARISNDSTCKV